MALGILYWTHSRSLLPETLHTKASPMAGVFYPHLPAVVILRGLSLILARASVFYGFFGYFVRQSALIILLLIRSLHNVDTRN